MNNETDVSIRFRNYVSGEGKLEKYAQTLAKIKSVTDGLNKKTLVAIEDGSKNTKNINEETSKMSKNINTAFNYTVVREFTRGLKSAFTTLSKLTDKSASYLENINLFQVAFGGAYQEAERFINKMSEMYGLDESKLTNTVGIFRQLANAMNLSVETGTRLATLMTQMSVDISSLYNIDVERASSVLQSSLAGQTKPIRGATGADITESTLQTTLNTIGLDKYVGDLSYAEKRLLIIISLTEQLSESTNDFARTIESPANQMRIMNEQWERLSRAVGNTFLPALSQVLPYLNATLMVLTEIFSVVASLFGYNKDDFDYFAGVSDSVLDLEESLGGASENAKKLKQGLRGFDKLNVIKTPSSNGSSGGTGTIDPKIMDAFNKAFDDYNSKLTDVTMKATKIRDAVMEWLGFTKKIHPLTGDISWTYNGIKTTLRNLWSWFKKLSPEAKAVSLFIAGMFTKTTINLLTKFVKLIGNTGLFKWIKSLVSPLKSLVGMFGDDLAGGLTGLSSSLGESVNMWSKTLTVVDRLKLTFVGAGGLLVSFSLLKDAMNEVSYEGLNLNNTLKLTTGVLGNIASGALIGSQFGAWGAVIGGVSGAFISLMESIKGYKTESEKAREELENSIEKNKEYSNSLIGQHEEIQNQIQNAQALTSVHKNLVDELTQIVDANGRVKLGYEDRANFIVGTLNSAYGLELQIIDGIVQEYDEQIDKIYELIEAKKTEIYLEKAEERYTLALEERAEAYDNLITSQNDYNNALKDLEDAEEKLKPMIENWNKLDESTQKAWGSFDKYVKNQNWFKSLDGKEAFYAWEKTKDLVDKATESYNNAKDAYSKNTEAIMQYQGLLSASTENNGDKILYWQNEIEKSYAETTEGVKWTLSDRITDAELFYQNYINLVKDNNEEINNEVENSANERYNEVTSILLNEKNYIEGMTDEYVEAWGTLSKLSEKKFLENFSKLPEDIQQDVIDKMYAKGYTLSEEIQKGIDAKPPTVYFRGDTSSISSKLQSFLNNNSKLFGALGITVPKVSFWADGGLPPVGQLFVANERGPELVGSIGGQSFVANQNQMMDLLDRKIGNANNGMKNATFVIQVGDEVVARKVLNDLQDMAKSDGKPIVIS